jgi:alpha-galactosidase
MEMLMRPLHDGSVAIGIFNWTNTAAQTQFTRNQLPASFTGKEISMQDLWRHEAVAMLGGTFQATVPSHGVVMLKVSVK